jgi:hypothetical protein
MIVRHMEVKISGMMGWPPGRRAIPQMPYITGRAPRGRIRS